MEWGEISLVKKQFAQNISQLFLLLLAGYQVKKTKQ